MIEEEKTKFKQMLLEERATIEKELAEAGRPMDGAKNEWEAVPLSPDDSVADPNEQADREEDFNEREGITSTLGARHADIVSALERIESGVYGLCEVCGKPIENARLEANPAAKTCMEHI